VLQTLLRGRAQHYLLLLILLSLRCVEDVVLLAKGLCRCL
jgi:hypothetical protein